MDEKPEVELQNSRDGFYLRSYGADLTDKGLIAMYDELRECWDRGNEKGELPRSVLLYLSALSRLSEAKPAAKETAKKATGRPKKSVASV